MRDQWPKHPLLGGSIGGFDTLLLATPRASAECGFYIIYKSKGNEQKQESEGKQNHTDTDTMMKLYSFNLVT